MHRTRIHIWKTSMVVKEMNAYPVYTFRFVFFLLLLAFGLCIHIFYRQICSFFFLFLVRTCACGCTFAYMCTRWIMPPSPFSTIRSQNTHTTSWGCFRFSLCCWPLVLSLPLILSDGVRFFRFPNSVCFHLRFAERFFFGLPIIDHLCIWKDETRK